MSVSFCVSRQKSMYTHIFLHNLFAVRLQQGFLVKSVFKGILKMVKPRLAPFLELTLEEYDHYCVAVMDEIERNKGLTEWKVITARKA